MKLDVDDFELFAMPRQFGLARDTLDSRWKSLQGEVHPDKFAAQGAAAQRVAMQWAVRVNEAYQRLKDPLKRAAYLCELNGVPIDAERNTAMPPAFLAQQMAWREALEDASDTDELDRLAQDVAARRRDMLARLQHLLDEQQDPHAAAAEVRALMFVERFAEEVERRQEAAES
ncbi:Fe-S protein assembly co-chaperone HscB [Caldimonas brevitalea]|uniref:Co-chaperone protein HscB homolog n=1 Tax=Caldimonas brevitalea TaxID=413882 RepID=A0A0G3BTQ8_9BURK|nr:Fe-S protein assembly co-chaperone HscB [Caldimonas brevitalea]AKJ29920.1 co-chaperone HscB [Caldimonas brevitalea]